jgi:CBS domain-containing protein
MELLLKETREVVSKIRQQQGKSPDYVVTCALDNTVDDVISKMMSEKVHRVYITTPTQRLHSVITLTDILRFFEWGRTRQKKKE